MRTTSVSTVAAYCRRAATVGYAAVADALTREAIAALVKINLLATCDVLSDGLGCFAGVIELAYRPDLDPQGMTGLVARHGRDRGHLVLRAATGAGRQRGLVPAGAAPEQGAAHR